jgi:hypothetical protein
MTGMVSPMLAIADPKARLRLIWIRSPSAARAAARVSGSRTSKAITTPTNDCGKPAARTPASIAGDSTFASPTTATSATSSRQRLPVAAPRVGAGPWSSSSRTVPPSATGRKKLRCRRVWVRTKSTYSTSDAAAANVSCAGENRGPGTRVNVGSTRLSVARVVTVASAAPLPSGLNSTVPKRSEPSSSARPTIPLVVIMTAANTVSRASEAVSWPPESMSVTIRPTSITVTATARTSDPNGSPTRCATTSAWCTAASTAPASSTATTPTQTLPGFRPQTAASTASPRTGTRTVQDSSGERRRSITRSP